MSSAVSTMGGSRLQVDGMERYLSPHCFRPCLNGRSSSGQEIPLASGTGYIKYV